MDPILIRGGRVIDPAQGIDRTADLLLAEGVVRGVYGRRAAPSGARVIDAEGMVVCPGFIDLHCHLREPGFEYRETIATGTLAAARGGFTAVCAMPNTEPVIDSRALVDFVLRRAREEASVRVMVIGAVTKGSKGTGLVEMAELAETGVVGFSDDGHPVADPNVMRQALSYSSPLGLPVINHCEAPELSAGGAANEGWIATRLGLKGIPNAAEEVMVARDISLAQTTGGRLHIAHASTAGTMDLVRQAKERGLNVTCEATPHHLTLSDEALLGHGSNRRAFAPLTGSAYDTNAKVAPPLRARADVDAVVQALKDGVVDFIATDHAPHNQVEKLCTFEEAANGISVLETALGSLMSLVHTKDLPLPLLIDKLTAGPARFLGVELGSLKPGAPADVTIFDPDAEWVVDASTFASKGKNTPLDGTSLKGQVVTTIVGGVVKYEEANAAIAG
ncbi:MAG: dihydroorotase [Candidatus Brocadiia bacterium]|jgi:dihydroorotase|nr:dihydroorotase [Candidatus Brocadiia bacterium]